MSLTMLVDLSPEARGFIKYAVSLKAPDSVLEPIGSQEGLDLYRLCESLIGNPLIECSGRSGYKALYDADWTSPSVETEIDGKKAYLAVGTVLDHSDTLWNNTYKHRGVALFLDDNLNKGGGVFLFEAPKSGNVRDSQGKLLLPEQIGGCLSIVRAMIHPIHEWRRQCSLTERCFSMSLRNASLLRGLQCPPGIHFL